VQHITPYLLNASTYLHDDRIVRTTNVHLGPKTTSLYTEMRRGISEISHFCKIVQKKFPLVGDKLSTLYCRAGTAHDQT